MNIKFLRLFIFFITCCIASTSFSNNCRLKKDSSPTYAMFTNTCEIDTTRSYIKNEIEQLIQSENLSNCKDKSFDDLSLRFTCENNKYIIVYCGENGSGFLKDNKCQLKKDSQPEQTPIGEIFTGGSGAPKGDVFH